MKTLGCVRAGGAAVKIVMMGEELIAAVPPAPGRRVSAVFLDVLWDGRKDTPAMANEAIAFRRTPNVGAAIPGPTGRLPKSLET
jgi:hypothetical protein